jgi:hypothetical protein
MCIDLHCLSPAFVEDSSFPIDDASVLESTNPRSKSDGKSDESRGKQRVALTSLEEEIPDGHMMFLPLGLQRMQQQEPGGGIMAFWKWRQESAAQLVDFCG